MLKIDEKKLIAGLQELRQIEPRKEWVFLVKERILGDAENVKNVNPSFSFWDLLREIGKGEKMIFNHKPAFASILSLVVIFGLFGFTQNALPGDALFSIKKIAEKGQSILMAKDYQSKYDLELAGRRLDELAKIAQSNSAEKLAPAINEVKESIAKAAGSIVSNDGQNKSDMVKKIVSEVKSIEEKTEMIKSLGVEIGNNEDYNSALAGLIESQINDLETRTLTEEQKVKLNEIKKDYQEKNYSLALEGIYNF